jgi:hypothetical protein
VHARLPDCRNPPGLPGRESGAKHQRPIVRDHIGGGALGNGRVDRADIDVTRQSSGHRHETVGVTLHAAGVAEHHAYLREISGKDESLDDVEELGRVVQIGFEVRRVDREQALCAGGHAIHGTAHLVERSQHRHRRGRGRQRRGGGHVLRQNAEFEFPGIDHVQPTT